MAVIVVTYNAEPYLEDCLGALRRMDHGDLDVEVMVVENASTDDTRRIIESTYPWVTLFAQRKNLGFAGGNDVAMAHAIAAGFDYIYLLNQDTLPTPGFLDAAVAAAESDATIGAVQSLILLHPETSRINSTGNAIHFLGFGYCEDYRKPVEKWRAQRKGGEPFPEIAYASGAGVLYRCSVLGKIGLFNEEFFMYHEDLDLGWRMRIAGFRSVLAPDSVIHHKYEFSRSVSKWYYMERNRYLVLLANLRTWTFIVLLPWIIAMEVMLTLTAVKGGWYDKKLKAMLYFLHPRSWVRVMMAHDRVAGIRTRGDREVMRVFVAEIDHQETTSLFVSFVANPLMRAAWAFSRLFIV